MYIITLQLNCVVSIRYDTDYHAVSLPFTLLLPLSPWCCEPAGGHVGSGGGGVW